MQNRQGTVTVIADSPESALAWLNERYVSVHSDSQGGVWRPRKIAGSGYLVYEDNDGVTLTFRVDEGG